MALTKNQNLFTGDRAYQTSRTLTFKSRSSEDKFQTDTFLRTRYFLQGYVLLCLLYLIFNTIMSECFNFYHNCRYTTLLLASVVCLIATFLPIKLKNSALIRLFLILPSLYIHLVILDSYTYYLSLHLIIIQTSLTSGLIFNNWKSHAIANLATYGILALVLKYLNAEYLVMGNISNFSQDLLLYSIMPLTIVTYIEKGRRERWVLLETFKRSERSFMTLVEKTRSPIFVIDGRKRVVYANQNGMGVLSKYFPHISPKVPIHKTNANFEVLLTNPSKKIFDTALEECVSEGTVKRICLKEPLNGDAQANHDSVVSNPKSTINRPEDLEESPNVYELTCVRTLWKNYYAYIVSIQDVTTPVKVQSSVSKRYSQVIQSIREYIEAAQNLFETPATLSIPSPAQRALLQSICNLDSLQYAILNSSAAFDMTRDKVKVERGIFNIRDTIVYLFEILSIKSIKQKVEMSLKFEPSFPDQVTGDSFRFAQILHNLMINVIESSKDSKIQVVCNLKTVLTGQGKYLLEFNVEFPENDTMKYENVKALLESEEDEEITCSIDVLKKAEREIQLELHKPLVKKLSGETKVNKKQDQIEVSTLLTFDNDEPSPSQKNSHKEWRLPALSKFNLTNTKTKANKNLYTWNAAPFPVSNENNQMDNINSPFVMKEKLSEKIKQQFNESQSSSGSSIQRMNSGLNSQSRTTNFEEFRRNKLSLMQMTGGKDSLNQTPPQSGPEKLDSKELEKPLLIAQASLTVPHFNIAEVVHSPNLKEGTRIGNHVDSIAMNIKRQKAKQEKAESIVKDLKELTNPPSSQRKSLEGSSKESLQTIPQEEQKLAIAEIEEEKSNDKEETKLNVSTERSSKANPQITIEEATPTRLTFGSSMFTDEKKGSLRTSEIDEESLTRGIKRVKSGKRKCKSTSSQQDVVKVAEMEAEEQEKEKELEKVPEIENSAKLSPYKPLKPSYFNASQSEIITGHAEEYNKGISDLKAQSVQSLAHSEVLDEEDYTITRERLKINENNLRIAVANILLGILTMYGRKKRASATVSRKLSEKEEESGSKEKPKSKGSSKGNSNQLLAEEKEMNNQKECNKEIERAINESFLDGKLNANEFIDRIMELLAQRIFIEKNEKEFMSFLSRYVQIVEQKLRNHDFRTFNKGSMNSLDDEPNLGGEYNFPFVQGETGFHEDIQRFGQIHLPVPPRRKNSGDSIFSVNSDAMERPLNLSERMLVTPSVMALLRRNLHPKKHHHHSRKETKAHHDDSHDEDSAGKKSTGESTYSVTKNASDRNDKDDIKNLNAISKDSKELIFLKFDREKEIIPWDIPVEELPCYISVRMETQKRHWTGGQTHLQEEEFKDYSFLEDFTVLVVDDNSFIFKGLEMANCLYRKSLDYAKDGLDGFSKYKALMAERLMYHIIFMDVMMPLCDGLEATRMIRDYEIKHKCPRTFIIALSSFEDEATRIKCLEAGMDDYCCKPIKIQTLNQIIYKRCQVLGISPKMNE